MLVLSRKVGQRVILNGNIIVEVVEFHGHKVRLGFTAPDDVEIMREELLPGNREGTGEPAA